MKIGKITETVIEQDLKVENKKVTHDKNGKFSERYEGKLTRKEAKEHKYLNFVISIIFLNAKDRNLGHI